MFPHDGDLYLVEEFYPSYIQQYLVEDGTPFNEQQIKFIMYSAARGLLFLKQRFLIHGVFIDCINHFQDVKPGNLLVSSSNAIVLTDFGSSRRCNDDGYYYPEKSCILTL